MPLSIPEARSRINPICPGALVKHGSPDGKPGNDSHLYVFVDAMWFPREVRRGQAALLQGDQHADAAEVLTAVEMCLAENRPR